MFYGLPVTCEYWIHTHLLAYKITQMKVIKFRRTMSISRRQIGKEITDRTPLTFQKWEGRWTSGVDLTEQTLGYRQVTQHSDVHCWM
jgi:hypothetical protein